MFALRLYRLSRSVPHRPKVDDRNRRPSVVNHGWPFLLDSCMRAHYTWTLPRTTIALGRRTAVMGILNVTPDSFSDGGLYSDPSRAVDRAMEIEAQGAD